MGETTTAGQYAAVRRLCASGTGRYVRQANGASLREIAKDMSQLVGEPVSPSTVLRYELGQVRPVGQRALAYLRVINELMAATGARPARAASRSGRTPQDDVRTTTGTGASK